MGMNVLVGIMGGAFTEMTMDVEMGPAVSVPVTMEMKAGAPQANEHVSAQQDKHHADDAFQRPRQVFTETQIQKDSRTGKDQQSQRMAQTPNRAMGGAVRRTDRVPVQSDDKAAT